jgi:hypothetical protein
LYLFSWTGVMVAVRHKSVFQPIAFLHFALS